MSVIDTSFDFENMVREINTRPVPVMRVLYSVSGTDACSFYRCLQPAQAMFDKYFDYFRPTLKIDPDADDVKEHDVMVVQRVRQSHSPLIGYARKLGKMVIYEHDDLDMHLPVSHSLYQTYKLNNTPAAVRQWANAADAVTVSTRHLAEEYRRIGCKRVKVWQNVLDLSLPNWNLPRIPSDKIRIGWAGGSTHYEDLKMIAPSIRQILKDFPNTVFILGGYNPRGVILDHTKDPKTGELKTIVKRDTRNLSLDEIDEEWERANGFDNVWYQIKDLFASVRPEQFQIRETRPLNDYPKTFTEFDITLAPMIDNRFTRCKSHLKILEAWGSRTPVIASRIGEYTDTVEHGVNGFLLKKGKPKDCYKYLKRLILEPEFRHQMAENGRKTLEAEYSLREQTDQRFEWLYRSYRNFFKT